MALIRKTIQINTYYSNTEINNLMILTTFILNKIIKKFLNVQIYLYIFL